MHNLRRVSYFFHKHNQIVDDKSNVTVFKLNKILYMLVIAFTRSDTLLHSEVSEIITNSNPALIHILEYNGIRLFFIQEQAYLQSTC